MNRLFLGAPTYKIQSEIFYRNTIGRYVQNGLIAAYDGQANSVDFFHSNDPSKWQDCSGNGNNLVLSTTSPQDKVNVHDKYYEFMETTGKGARYSTSQSINDEPKTIEAVIFPKSDKSMSIFHATYERPYYFHLTQICGSDGHGNISLGYTSTKKFLDLGTEKKIVSISLSKNANKQTATGTIDGNNTEFTDTVSGWGCVYSSGKIIIGNCLEDNFAGANSPSSNPLIGNVYCIRVYNRRLTEEERLHNLAVDQDRFGIEA